jgi:hypothetical protein
MEARAREEKKKVSDAVRVLNGSGLAGIDSILLV